MVYDKTYIVPPVSSFRRFVLCFFLCFWIVALSSAADLTSGYFSGSFDPPTLAHESIVRTALQNYPLKRITIFINKDGPKEFKASVAERVAMLKAGLSDVWDKIEVVPVFADEKLALVHDRAHQGRYFHFIGADSYEKLPRAALDEPNSHWVIISRGRPENQTRRLNVTHLELPDVEGLSSTQARTSIFEGKDSKSDLSPAVYEYVRQRHLYEAPGEDFKKLALSLQREGFAGFLSDMKIKFPKMDFSGISPPHYDPQQSKNARAETFLRQVERQARFSPSERATLRKEGRLLLFATYKDTEYAKIPFVVSSSDRATASNSNAKHTSQLNQEGLRLDPKDYNLNVDDYVKERIPAGVQHFILENKAQVFIHEGRTDEALAYHRDQGFTDTYAFSSKRHNGKYLLVRNPIEGMYRMVIPSIGSEDRLAQIRTQLAGSPHIGDVSYVVHGNPVNLFEANKVGHALSLNSRDRVIIGFKNTVWRALESTGLWEREALTSAGHEISLYTNSRTGERIVGMGCVYGDELPLVLEFFYRKGGRDFSYLGTVGSLNNRMRLGDVVIPSKVNDGEKKWIRVKNEAQSLSSSVLPTQRVHRNTAHGWVQSILSESNPRLKTLKSAGIKTIDIEGKYFADFFRKHSNAKTSLVYFVSDHPLGEITYDQHNATLGKIQDSAAKFVKNWLGANHSCAEVFRDLVGLE